MWRLRRSLRTHFLKLIKAKTVTIDGVVISTRSEQVPTDVREALFRDAYEDTERKLLLKVLKPKMRVVEIGAGIGFIGLLAARIVGEQNIWCYEANPSLEPIIRGNHALNGLTPNLTMKAVTIDGAPISFFRSDNIISSSFYDRDRGDQKIMVDSVSFQNVIEERDPDVIVMDVEGAEVDLLVGPVKNRVRHLIVELHPHIVGPQKIDNLLTHLADEGFVVSSRDRKTVHLQRTV